MFGLFSKKKQLPPFDFSLLQTDMHSHLLPGIDDGSPDMATTVEHIRNFQALGYKKIITTPHVLWDMYRNTSDSINEKLADVKAALQAENIDMPIHAAAEYFLDDHFARMIQEKEPLLTIKDNLVLVEFSTMHMSISMKEIIFNLQMAGYQPVLAHPERYAYLVKNKEIFDELRGNGCMFQLNLLSAYGGYGKVVLELCDYLISNNFYSLIGTDLHHNGHMERLKGIQTMPALQKLLDSGKILNATL